ncbi:cation diffusion facilitator CzcD-associated flavoprotein CzcO [Jeotgalibacillus terrae]|nr:cation diffusion facilitator CzcD-associated flavoprotein CzcO [Jeotgalibacillus terrae]
MIYDVVIIGGGQAGLVMGYNLKNRKVSFLITDASSEVGETWKQRYDSLRLFTPDYFSSLPGLRLEAKSYPTKDEIANYLKLYTTEEKTSHCS